MRCSNVRQALSEARYEKSDTETSIARHLAECEACGEFVRASERLDALLQLDQPVEPRPGFDTRFFARLAELKASGEERQTFRRSPIASWLGQWRWVLGGLSLACAVLVMVVARQPSRPTELSGDAAPLSDQDLGLVRDLELLQDLDLVNRLQEVETFEVVAQLELGELERAAGAVAAEPKSEQGGGR